MKITPIQTGTIRCNQSIITLGRGFDRTIDIPATARLVECRDHHLLVDTGMCDTERAGRTHYEGSVQNEEQRIDRALAKMGLAAGDIETVIFTHLHWDHCSNAGRFTKACFFVQETELSFAKNPIPPYYASYESRHLGLVEPFEGIPLTPIAGDKLILPGIHALSTPGHSPGHQSVLVETEKGRYVIAGDAVMSYDNLEKDPKRGTDYRMIGRYMDFAETWKSFEKITKAADFILPAHDFRVFDKGSYP